MSTKPPHPSQPGPLPPDFDPRNFALFASQELLDPKQAEIIRTLTQQFVQNPELLASLDSVAKSVRSQLTDEQLQATALESFGWPDESQKGEDLMAMPTPKQAAAAVGAAVAAVAGGPGVAVAAAA